MTRSAGFVATLAGTIALLGPLAVVASDDDEDPPYMIYIDPETGKYTTVDPLSGTRAAPAMPVAATGAAQSPDADAVPRWAIVAAAAAAVLLGLAGRQLLQRRRRRSAPGHIFTPI